jgi:hypothetical protein
MDARRFRLDVISTRLARCSAMDYPYQSVPGKVVVRDNLPLDAGDKRKFFQTNAERLFSL